VVKELLTDEHKYRLAFAERIIDCRWGSVIFSDESTVSSANDGTVLIYRPQGELYNSQYVVT
jgi:hypothetical protein